MNTKIAIIGGGPAGLAAAISAYDAGVKDIVIIERDKVLGGILNQCIHNGFGLHTFKEELTGPEYADRFIKEVQSRNIKVLLRTIVVDVSPNRVLTVMSKEDGLYTIEAESIILTMGCRERPRGALNTPGYRPSGIYSAGTAQRFVNIEGKLPGHEVVILGSGDIGLIMARRMTLEGATVKAVAEIMPYSGGLKRNIVQCLDDFNIPLKLSTTVIDIKGKDRVEAVVLAKVDSNSKPIPGSEEEIKCDTLLLSCGLLPENELSVKAGVELSKVTGGPIVNESFETSAEGIFAAGNVLHVHDLVDYVSKEAGEAGTRAAKYVLNGSGHKDESEIKLETGNGVRYTVPSTVRKSEIDKFLTVRFRVGNVYKNCEIVVSVGDREIRALKKQICSPGEMEQVVITPADIGNAALGEAIKIEIREAQNG